MKKQASKKVLPEADPIYKDVSTILKTDDKEKVRLLRLFISSLVVNGQQKKIRS